VFPSGIDRRDDLGLPDRLDIYYGMADKRIGVARLAVPELFGVRNRTPGPPRKRPAIGTALWGGGARTARGEGFEHLLGAGDALAAERSLQRIEAGMNLNRSQDYRQMRRRGFRTDIQGVAMHKPDSPAYNRTDAFVVDDWR